MVWGELKLFATFFLLSLFSEFVVAGKSEVFRITSNVTMQRMWKNNLSKDPGEEKSLTSRLDNILNPYLQSTNENEAIQAGELTEKVEILNLKDVYINTCDSQILLQNVNYTDLNAFHSSPIQVETKIKEISNHRIAQIVGSIETHIMTLHGEMILQDSTYYFTANLTKPTFHVETNISDQISLKSGPTSEGQLESFTFEDLAISIHPKDMHSVALKKLELRTSILQRLADTWLPVIANSMNNLLLPKMKQHEKLLTEDSNSKKFIRNVCDLISQHNEIKISSPAYSSQSATLKGLSNFSHCGGDAMVVKKYSSFEMYNLRHNISILLNYNLSGLLIAKESEYSSYETSSTTPYYRRTTRGYYDDYYGTSSTPKPTPEPSCEKIYVNNIEATIAFELEMGKTKVKRILSTDLVFSMDESSVKGCTYATTMNLIKSHFSRKLEEYPNNVGQ